MVVRVTGVGIVGCALTGYGLISVLGDSGPVGILDGSSEIDSCTTIDQPGRYKLTENITSSNEDTCIEIEASNVILSGHGHTIDGIREGFTKDASIAPSGSTDEKFSNVTVQNLTVTDWSTGIGLGGSMETTLSNNTVTTNSIGIYIHESDGTTLTNSVITGNNETGLWIGTTKNTSIYKNYLNNTNNVEFGRNSTRSKTNAWNVSSRDGPNIVGGPHIGGNYYAIPNGTGVSQTCADRNDDGFCDTLYDFNENGSLVDSLPLTGETTQPPTAENRSDPTNAYDRADDTDALINTERERRTDLLFETNRGN